MNKVGDARNVDELPGDLLDDTDINGLNNVREGLSNGLLIIVTAVKQGLCKGNDYQSEKTYAIISRRK